MIYQYNLKNYYKFYHLGMPRSYAIGRIIELIPYSSLGFFISNLEIFKFLTKFRLKTVIICIYFLYFLLNYQTFNIIQGYEYQGIKLIFVSLCIFISFEMFPSHKINNTIIIKIVKILTKYTAGVYYLHRKISEYITPYIKSIRKRTLKGCLITYLICYFISFMAGITLGKTKFRHLFE